MQVGAVPQLRSTGDLLIACPIGTTTVLAAPPVGTLRFFNFAFTNPDAVLTATISLVDGLGHIFDRNITPAGLYFNFISAAILDQNTGAAQVTVSGVGGVGRVQWWDSPDDGTIVRSAPLALTNAYQAIALAPTTVGRIWSKNVNQPGGASASPAALSWLNNNDTAVQPELRMRVTRLSGVVWVGIESSTGLGSKNRQAGIGGFTGLPDVLPGDVVEAKLASNPVVAGSIVLRMIGQIIAALPGSG
jgi:hypothetical protein